MLNGKDNQVSYKRLIAFFIPLGISASLTSITHVIINGTMTRGENAAFIIACYAVAFALFGIVERPIIVFRQTSSALVHDKYSFKLLIVFFLYIMGGTLLLSSIVAYTPLGDWLYIRFFNADENMVHTISQTFKVISVVIIFSGIRGIYQGIIINHLETKWLTIGVVVRLIAMFIVAFVLVKIEYVTSAGGAFIFLAGMIIECIISVWKGQFLVKVYPEINNNTKLKKTEIYRFYTPLVLYFIIQTVLIPVIYMFLANTEQIEMSIASFALAYSITNLVLSFYMYTHQIVLQFYEQSKKKVLNFTLWISIIPSFLLAILSFSPLGYWFMESIMGADPILAANTLIVLKFFILKTLVYPVVDFFNGFLMLQRQTNRMLIPQTFNLFAVLMILSVLVYFVPHWNGVNGAIATSLGEVVGLIVVFLIVTRMNSKKKNEQKVIVSA